MPLLLIVSLLRVVIKSGQLLNEDELKLPDDNQIAGKKGNFKGRFIN
jgi:hypothetical protein